MTSETIQTLKELEEYLRTKAKEYSVPEGKKYNKLDIYNFGMYNAFIQSAYIVFEKRAELYDRECRSQESH